MPEITKLENGDYLIVGQRPALSILEELNQAGKLPGIGEGAIVVSQKWLEFELASLVANG